jgi:DNA-binding NarL/FixJ family response regulator
MSMDLNLLPPLTRRERELITLIARGMQNKNIAHELNISEHTVRAHIGNIMRKYRLQNRTQIAVTLAVTNSLHPFSDESAA